MSSAVVDPESPSMTETSRGRTLRKRAIRGRPRYFGKQLPRGSASTYSMPPSTVDTGVAGLAMSWAVTPRHCRSMALVLHVGEGRRVLHRGSDDKDGMRGPLWKYHWRPI